MEENIKKQATRNGLDQGLNIAIFGSDESQFVDFTKANLIFLDSFADVIAHATSADITVVKVTHVDDKEIIIYLDQTKTPFVIIDGELDNSVLDLLVENILKCKSLGFSNSDFANIQNYGVSIDAIANHINFFNQGLKKIALNRAAIDGDGIIILDENEISKHARHFDEQKETQVCQKFVPASGAASRMFSFLSKFVTDFNPDSDCIEKYIEENQDLELQEFISNSDKFPFSNEVNDIILQQNADFNKWSEARKHYHFVKVMLDETDLNFAFKPKGVIPFHSYESFSSTPTEEHIKEAFEYAFSQNNARLHFTVSEEHQSMFEEIVKKFLSKDRLEVEYSYQDKSTDTIAVDLDNKPFRNGNDQLLFRPSGHGALISNLNNLNADVIFIKNIDNVTNSNIDEISLHKKALAGVLVDLQTKIFDILNQIDNSTILSDNIPNITSFLANDLNIHLPKDFAASDFEQQKKLLKEALSRPIRVCGMVKNQGEPGGGPFWIEDEHGISLQIVETSQIDLENQQQSEILKSATYFNPVDLVCGIKNHKGEKYNLHDFVDYKSGFIVNKNHEGTDIKAYELPGLWNGAMARWISVFVEVPLSTFNPVKTVNDLLKPAHQPQPWK